MKERFPTDYQVVGIVPSWTWASSPAISTALPGGGSLSLPGVSTRALAGMTLILFSRMAPDAIDEPHVEVEMLVTGMEGVARGIPNSDEFFPLGLIAPAPDANTGSVIFGEVRQLFAREL
jgi:hypothetical protein